MEPAILLWAFFIIFLIAAYWIPTIIAFQRKHEYKLVILGLNFCGVFFGITWLIAVIWAAWPHEKGLADPVIGNPTGRGLRAGADVFGAVPVAMARGAADEVEKTRERNELKQQQAAGAWHKPTYSG